MISVSSSSIGYAYQLWFILYRGKPAIFCCCFLNLFVYCKRLCCFGYTISQAITVVRIECELRFSNVFLYSNQPLISSAVLSFPECVMLNRMGIIFYCGVLVFTSLLFFFRTRAVFTSNPWVTAFFAALWLAVLGSCLALIAEVFKPMPATSTAKTTAVCLSPDVGPLIALTTIIPLINDTLVFLAISWRLSRNSYEPYTVESGIRFLVFGDYLPVFSKALLRSGQAYYLSVLSWSMSRA